MLGSSLSIAVGLYVITGLFSGTSKVNGAAHASTGVAAAFMRPMSGTATARKEAVRGTRWEEEDGKKASDDI